MLNTNPLYKKLFESPVQEQLLGLASPIQLQVSITEITLEDYFIDVSLIDEVVTHKLLDVKLSEDKRLVWLTPKEGLPKLSELIVWLQGIPYSILVKRSRKIRSEFEFNPEGKQYSLVQIAGDMNNWAAHEGNMEWVEGQWKISYDLNPGKYGYQFVLDGNWVLDPNNPNTKDNNMGSYNSMAIVGGHIDEVKPVIHTQSFQANNIELMLDHALDEVIVLWNNFRLSASHIKQQEKRLWITIPQAASQEKRSTIRVFGYKGDQEANDLKLLLDKGKVIQDSKQLLRTDKESYIMYFIMVDRFLNGDPSLDAPVNDERLHPKANFYGGDLFGIYQKLKEGYFRDLNINTLWLSPLTENPLGAFQEWPAPHHFFAGYHGYWPTSHTDIDFRFGDYDILEKLIDELHQQKSNFILDFVSNHVHQEHPLYKQHPNWVTPLKLDDGRMNIRLWNDQRFSTWFETFLPTLDYSNPEVVKVMTDVAIYWLKEFDIDGFRHDATKHIPEYFWRALTLKIKKEVLLPDNRSIYQVGETFGSREMIDSYTSSGLMDGQFDFNLYFDARRVFGEYEGSFRTLHFSLMESLAFYGYHHLMCNITGNHDLSRFISYAGGSISFDEDTKMAGWTREIAVGNEEIAYKRLSALTAFIMTIPGIPVINYGDEIGMPGAEDPDNRRPMKFDQLTPHELKTKEIASKLAGLRKSRLSLILGDFELLHVADQTYAYARSYFDEFTIVAFNKSSEPQSLNLELPERFRELKLSTNFEAKVWRRKNSLKLTLAAEGFEVLTTNRKPKTR